MIYQPMTTARFIELASAKHGSLYDYSKTVFVASNSPISFGCTRCGKRVTLSQATSHLRLKRPCGCRTCNRSRKRICGGCGTVVPAAEFHKNGKRCRGCRESDLMQSRIAVTWKHEKQCKECGVTFSDRDKVFCSDDCRRRNVESRLTYSCCHCGGTVRKRSVSTARFQFCNKDCQTAFQGSQGYDRTGRIRSSANRSKMAKRKYQSDQRKQRKAISEGYQWWKLCKTEIRRTKHHEKDEWDSRCSNALSALKARFEPAFKLKSQKVWSWGLRVADSRKNLCGNKTQDSREDLAWKKKCTNALKMSKLRVQRSGAMNTGKLG